MNKKFLICGAIATALVVSACVKKETPSEEQHTPVEEIQKKPQTPEAQFEDLSSVEPEAPQQAAPSERQVEVVREETANTSTVIRREVREVQPQPEPRPTPRPEPRAEQTEPKPAPRPEPRVEPAKPAVEPRPANNTESQSQEDAIAAAMAAAMPALD